MSSSELAQLQSCGDAAPAKPAFGGVLSTLQSLGYVDINADKDLGTVSAITDAKAKTIFNIFWGFGKKKWTQKASLLIEEDGAGSRVRLNMMLSETKARGIFGTSFTDGKIVRVAAPYQEFFQVLDAEMAQRGAVTRASAPASPATAAATDRSGKWRQAGAGHHGIGLLYRGGGPLGICRDGFKQPPICFGRATALQVNLRPPLVTPT